jgi:hypothetical protein
MKKYLGPFLSLCVFSDALGYTYISNAYVDTFPDNNIEVKSGVQISPSGSDGIKTKEFGPTYLHNYGSINGTIDTNGNNLFVYNTGTINGTINGGNVEQTVDSAAAMTKINVVGGNYKIKINNAQNIDFNLINNIDANFEITQSSIVVNNISDLNTWDKNVDLGKNVCLIINNIDSSDSEITIDNINSGKENLSVQLKNTDGLHAVRLENIGGNLVLKIVRATDYNIIYQNKNVAENSVLEQIRKNNPNDKLINALDNANTIDEINNIKNNSYRYNHSILLRPVKMINNFVLSDVGHENDGVIINPFYVFSDTVKDVGANMNVGHLFNNLYLNLGVNINSFSYVDDINDFSGMSYGLDIRAKQKISDLWIDGIAGLSLTKYKADYITKEDVLESDPLGVSGYGKVSVGYDFHLSSGLLLSPFVGTSYEKYSVADVDDSDLDVLGGGNVKYEFEVDGIKYNYAVMGSVTNNEDIYASVEIGFTSVLDGIGASVDASLFKNEYDCYYKLSLKAKVLF